MINSTRLAILVALACLFVFANGRMGFGPFPASAQAATASPALQAFVQRVVRQLNGAAVAPASDVDPEFNRLYDENLDLAPAQLGGAMDFRSDPVCQCFETGDHYTLRSLTARGENQAEARIRHGAPDSDYSLILERVGGAWRIRDVVNGMGSARAILVRHNACLRAGGGETRITRCFGDS